jgi:hypothetical protein
VFARGKMNIFDFFAKRDNTTSVGHLWMIHHWKTTQISLKSFWALIDLIFKGPSFVIRIQRRMIRMRFFISSNCDPIL